MWDAQHPMCDKNWTSQALATHYEGPMHKTRMSIDMTLIRVQSHNMQ